MRALEAKAVKRILTSTADFLNIGLAVNPRDPTDVLEIPLLPAKLNIPEVDHTGVQGIFEPGAETVRFNFKDFPAWHGNLSDWVIDRANSESSKNIGLQKRRMRSMKMWSKSLIFSIRM
jgi:hypothetical protein